NCTLQGRTRIGERCVIEPNSKISDTEIGNGVTIRSYSVITESRIEDGAVIEPFAHLRPLSEVKTNVTKDVPEGAPAISRVKQKNIRGRSKKIELHHKKGRKKKV
ncbi:MAG: hypothetical protein FJ106_14060, partial [Deltaproteobacteria bacterium]|nr:hypothetical protein [Deltaproteobacteria bacterium]